MADLFSEEWAKQAKDAINSFPDDDYRATKLHLYWDWIDAARKGFDGSWALGIRDVGGGPRYVRFDISKGEVTGAELSDEAPEATFVLAGGLEVWKDLYDGFDAGKAVMYRRLLLDKGDVFRFFDRIYFFTESLVAMSKVPTTIPT